MKNYLLCLSIFLLSCNKIEPGSSLTNSQLNFLRSLNLLDPDEAVLSFYSTYSRSANGNFITNKRIASYWIDYRDPSRDRTQYAYYTDIAGLDSSFTGSLTFCPYITVKRKNGEEFKAYFNDNDAELKKLYSKISFFVSFLGKNKN